MDSKLGCYIVVLIGRYGCVELLYGFFVRPEQHVRPAAD